MKHALPPPPTRAALDQALAPRRGRAGAGAGAGGGKPRLQRNKSAIIMREREVRRQQAGSQQASYVTEEDFVSFFQVVFVLVVVTCVRSHRPFASSLALVFSLSVSVSPRRGGTAHRPAAC